LAQRFIDDVEYAASRRKIAGERLAHADRLASLARENECNCHAETLKSWEFKTTPRLIVSSCESVPRPVQRTALPYAAFEPAPPPPARTSLPGMAPVGAPRSKIVSPATSVAS